MRKIGERVIIINCWELEDKRQVIIDLVEFRKLNFKLMGEKIEDQFNLYYRIFKSF